ncbi:amidohydrolase family protein [Chlorobium sp. KB01]|uniref:amidohydrolase family protein n=1 Tax=Chlorobium sp. KB01 TaxID=1917528 RepID=UPI0009764AAB|nr:amidohydrolase family protein [Chlorobium sp. KB01]
MAVFFDSHCHMMNLSHPNLTAMIKRTFSEAMPKKLIRYIEKAVALPLVVKILICFLLFLPLLVILLIVLVVGLIAAVLFLLFPSARRVLTGILKEQVANTMNLLAVMETDIGDCLIQLEEELRNKFETRRGVILYGDCEEKVYDKIVLTPLIMDFGLKNYKESKSPYKVRWKPIVAQVEDLFLGIRDYYLYRESYIKSTGTPVPPLFEIHPFMGINTRNYRLKSFPFIDGPPSLLEDLLATNFRDFADDTTPEMRYRNLSQRDRSKFDGNIKSIGSHDFIGIKVYPPLGFNPWPEKIEEGYTDDGELKREREKVEYLYNFCIERNIPITAHCSDGGFLVDQKYREFASPFKWAKVLEQQKYNKLRLNLAHFGGVERDDWRERIAEFLLIYDNVYTDISYQGVDEKIYSKLKLFLDRFGADERKRLIRKIIFGSDFMINLMNIEKYSTYLEYFAETEALTLVEKELLCHTNAMKFLYLA